MDGIQEVGCRTTIEKKKREREHFKSKHQICHADHYLVVNESKKGDY
jgi:hypothetical protein